MQNYEVQMKQSMGSLLMNVDTEQMTPQILDLSKKKWDSSDCRRKRDSTESLATSVSLSYSDNDDYGHPYHPQIQVFTQHQFSGIGLSQEINRKSPTDIRAHMVTPPSESESPKKLKNEPIFEHTNLDRMPLFPRVPQMSRQYHGMPPVSVLAQSSVVPQVPFPTINAVQNEFVSASVVHHDSGKKLPRPFKAYPADPLFTGVQANLIFNADNESFNEFRKRTLECVKKSSEGTNAKMRRTKSPVTVPSSTVDERDGAYWERRRKNNEAAKRSRDARRAKEDEIAIRAAFLERENIRLKYENFNLKTETARLKCLIPVIQQ